MRANGPVGVGSNWWVLATAMATGLLAAAACGPPPSPAVDATGKAAVALVSNGTNVSDGLG